MTTTAQKPPTAADFFKALYGEIEEGETLEIRTIYKEKVEQTQCISTEIAAGVAKLYNGGDVYFGVALRDGKGGKKANVTRITPNSTIVCVRQEEERQHKPPL